MKVVTTHLSICLIVQRLFIKLNNIGIMLSHANNIHLRQGINGYVEVLDNNKLTSCTVPIHYKIEMHNNLILYQLIVYLQFHYTGQ